MELTRDFTFEPLPALADAVHFPFPHLLNPLGPLAALPGTWKGTGFNTIWRPHFPKNPQDRFLELNLTEETLSFEAIPGPIPNRGLDQQDMNMFGLTYMQQISDSSNDAGLHVEPGIWAVVPPTSAPQEPATVVRMASIPHGTTILAQGISATTDGPPTIADNDIIPFGLNGAPPAKGTFAQAQGIFDELDLAAPSTFRVPSGTQAGITQAMVQNPNSVLQNAIAGQHITHTTTLVVSTTTHPVGPGGGTANTAFLADANAVATDMTSIFWIERVAPEHGPAFLQLQYTQLVNLDFNGLRWPHVTVGTLRKQHTHRTPLRTLDPHIPRELIEQAKAGPIPPLGDPEPHA